MRNSKYSLLHRSMKKIQELHNTVTCLILYNNKHLRLPYCALSENTGAVAHKPSLKCVLAAFGPCSCFRRPGGHYRTDLAVFENKTLEQERLTTALKDYLSTGLASKPTSTRTHSGTSPPRTIMSASAACGEALQKRFSNRLLA